MSTISGKLKLTLTNAACVRLKREKISKMNAANKPYVEPLELSTLMLSISYKLHCCTLPDKRWLSHGMRLYQIMMTLDFLNDVANDAESTQNRILRQNR